jgi:Peptidase propeptide and YPEB domain
MTPTAHPQVGRWGTRLTAGGPTWLRVGVIVAVLGVAFVAAQTCQKSSIRLDKEQAIAKAEAQVAFTPQRTQIRLLRQGLASKPYWIVSLSRPGEVEGTFSRLAVVRIDANTGEVESVERGHAPR